MGSKKMVWIAHVHGEDCAGRTFGEEGGSGSMNSTNVILHTSPIAKAENRLVYGQFIDEDPCCPSHFNLHAIVQLN